MWKDGGELPGQLKSCLLSARGEKKGSFEIKFMGMVLPLLHRESGHRFCSRPYQGRAWHRHRYSPASVSQTQHGPAEATFFWLTAQLGAPCHVGDLQTVLQTGQLCEKIGGDLSNLLPWPGLYFLWPADPTRQWGARSGIQGPGSHSLSPESTSGAQLPHLYSGAIA